MMPRVLPYRVESHADFSAKGGVVVSWCTSVRADAYCNTKDAGVQTGPLHIIMRIAFPLRTERTRSAVPALLILLTSVRQAHRAHDEPTNGR